jgi:endonuclease-3
VVRSLERLYPEPKCALEHRSPYQLLVATILSAQCTDARVNQVTPALFSRYPDPAALARSKPDEVEDLIHSTGFYRAKARNLRAMAARLVEAHGGEVPADLDALTALPGVGRKTANVVLGNAFSIASGVVVDTHVRRLAHRLGLTASRDPKVIERDLSGLVPRKHWVNLSHRLIEHGRKVCLARKPRCSACGLAKLCPKVGVTSRA